MYLVIKFTGKTAEHTEDHQMIVFTPTVTVCCGGSTTYRSMIWFTIKVSELSNYLYSSHFSVLQNSADVLMPNTLSVGR